MPNPDKELTELQRAMTEHDEDAARLDRNTLSKVSTMTNHSTTTEAALERCRFCGKESKGHWDGPYIHVSGAPDTLQFYSIVCNGCCSTASYETKERAIAKWNSRIPAPSVAPPNHALVQLLNAALLHPESAEGNIRQVSRSAECPPSVAPGVDDRMRCASCKHEFCKACNELDECCKCDTEIPPRTVAERLAQHEHIEVIEGVLGGVTPLVSRRRISVHHILGYLYNGESVDYIAQNYQLTLEAIKDAIAFAQDVYDDAINSALRNPVPAPVEQSERDTATPLCAVHQRLEDADKLECEIGNDCVACSLNERRELLALIAPFAAEGNTEHSVTVLRRVAEFYQTHAGEGRVVVSYPAPASPVAPTSNREPHPFQEHPLYPNYCAFAVGDEDYCKRETDNVIHQVPAPAARRDEADEPVDEVQHRMDQVVEAAVEWHQAGREGTEWFEAAEKLGAAINSLLELRGDPQANMPRRWCSVHDREEFKYESLEHELRSARPRHVGSSRHPHFTHADHERMKETLDALSDCPTEEEAEAVLQACGTSGKEVVNEFIERLLKENLELTTKLESATIPPSTLAQAAAEEIFTLVRGFNDLDELSDMGDGNRKHVEMEIAAIIERRLSDGGEQSE